MFTDSYPERRSIRAFLFDDNGDLLFHGVENLTDEERFDREGKLILEGGQHIGRARFYTTFGGGVEGDEPPIETLDRELMEELDATAVIGRELLALPGHRYLIARVTHLGDNPFTHGPEYTANATQRFWLERVTYEQACDPAFNLQPRLLQAFLRDYKQVVLTELANL